MSGLPLIPVPGQPQCQRRKPTMTIEQQKVLWPHFNSYKANRGENIANYSGSITSECGNCGGDHKFANCIGPVDEDFCLYGCPVHGTWQHSYDECWHPDAFTIVTLRLYLVFRRRNKPPIYTTRFNIGDLTLGPGPLSSKPGPLSRKEVQDSLGERGRWHTYDYSREEFQSVERSGRAVEHEESTNENRPAKRRNIDRLVDSYRPTLFSPKPEYDSYKSSYTRNPDRDTDAANYRRPSTYVDASVQTIESDCPWIGRSGSEINGQVVGTQRSIVQASPSQNQNSDGLTNPFYNQHTSSPPHSRSSGPGPDRNNRHRVDRHPFGARQHPYQNGGRNNDRIRSPPRDQTTDRTRSPSWNSWPTQGNANPAPASSSQDPASSYNEALRDPNYHHRRR